MKKITLSGMIVLLMTLTVNSIFGQEAKTSEITIKTSVVCDMCKENIEKNLAFEKGIKKSVVDVKNKTVTVTYNPQKTTPENIKVAISKIGYDADDVVANAKAYKKLDDCCKKEANCNDKK